MTNRHRDFKRQVFDDVVILPKKYFELGSVLGDYYCRHNSTNSWRSKKTNTIRRLKYKLERNEIIWIVLRTAKSQYIQRKSSFWQYLKFYQK